MKTKEQIEASFSTLPNVTYTEKQTVSIMRDMLEFSDIADSIGTIVFGGLDSSNLTDDTPPIIGGLDSSEL